MKQETNNKIYNAKRAWFKNLLKMSDLKEKDQYEFEKQLDRYNAKQQDIKEYIKNQENMK